MRILITMILMLTIASMSQASNCVFLRIKSSATIQHSNEGHKGANFVASLAKALRNAPNTRFEEHNICLKKSSLEGSVVYQPTQAMGFAPAAQLFKEASFKLFGLPVAVFSLYSAPQKIVGVAAKDGRLTADWLLNVARAYNLAHETHENSMWLCLMAARLSVHLQGTDSTYNYWFGMSDAEIDQAIHDFVADTKGGANELEAYSLFKKHVPYLSQNVAAGKEAARIANLIVSNRGTAELELRANRVKFGKK